LPAAGAVPDVPADSSGGGVISVAQAAASASATVEAMTPMFLSERGWRSMSTMPDRDPSLHGQAAFFVSGAAGQRVL
jgi:hypothetical protein